MSQNPYTRSPLRVVDGIPTFIEDTYYFRELGEYEVLTVTALARKLGWRTAILSIKNKLVRSYIADSSRLSFLSLVDVSEGQKILDLGAGWGSLSIQIAKRNPSVEVYAFDKTIEGLLFLAVVKMQEGLDNLHAARVDALDVPIGDAFFDLILMIGVLEWAGESSKGLKPRIAQEELLRESVRMLRKGGKLILGIENRFGYQYLAGKRDHSGHRFTSVIPKGMADFYMRTRTGKSYKTFIYDIRGYRQLLSDVGFSRASFYAALPNYRFPTVLADIENTREMMKLVKMKGAGRILRHLPDSVQRKIVPSFFIIAEK